MVHIYFLSQLISLTSQSISLTLNGATANPHAPKWSANPLLFPTSQTIKVPLFAPEWCGYTFFFSFFCCKSCPLSLKTKLSKPYPHAPPFFPRVWLHLLQNQVWLHLFLNPKYQTFPNPLHAPLPSPFFLPNLFSITLSNPSPLMVIGDAADKVSSSSFQSSSIPTRPIPISFLKLCFFNLYLFHLAIKFFFPMVFSSIFWLTFPFLSSSLFNHQPTILIFLPLWYFSSFLRPRLPFLLHPSHSNHQSAILIFLRLWYFLPFSYHTFIFFSISFILITDCLNFFSLMVFISFPMHTPFPFFLFLLLNTVSPPSLYGTHGIHAKQIIKK